MSAGDRALLLGAVAYDPKVVTIWDGFRAWFAEQDLPFDFVLYSNYERQVDDLIAGRIDVAWNSPLAWVRARRAAVAAGCRVSAPIMRDTDRDLTSIVIARAGSGIETTNDLRGKVVATGAVDSPQATLLPLDRLRGDGLEPDTDFMVRRFDVGVGLHGDHVGGERDAARALVAGEVDAACILAANHLVFAREGTLSADAIRVVAETEPFDHCNMTVNDDVADRADMARFCELLLGMDYGDDRVRPLLDLEGLTRWLPGRLDLYQPLERAVDRARFYDDDGRITARDYRP
ncbi:MAG TPA: PhnD/SsuA/transferrin family substrate-binding protein [Acidimicrobiia bacterium]|jgi:ABC-type phosphate/phosphonate transport system substrate-binding protein|nr:PhnD/SsuA/transferrin family substrate-binding protein [Acidimicrobiia bacterium]